MEILLGGTEMIMYHTQIGHWSYISKKRAKCILILFLIFTGISGCNQQGGEGTLVTTSLSPSLEPQLIPLPQGFVSPNWIELELPPDCRFGQLSPDSQWLTYRCRSGSSKTYKGWLAQICAGRLNNPVPWDWSHELGFTADSAGLVMEKDGAWWLLDLSDFTQQPYLSGTRGFHTPATRGWAWSPDGSRLAKCSNNNNCREILVFSPGSQTAEIVIEKTALNASKFSWSADSQEIAYIDGFPTIGDGTMAARVFNLPSGQTRTLIEDKFDLSGASWSRDGKWIAVRASEKGQSTALFLFEPQEGSRIKLEYEDLTPDRDAFNGWLDLTWSPDGSKLALSGWNIRQPDLRWVVVEVPTGKIVFQATKEDGLALLGWNTDGTALLALKYDSKEEREILRWVPVRP
jgi:WD40 repeat protein